MWFERPGISRQLFYPLRLTKHRENVQILVSQLEWRARAGDFFCVIHDGKRNSFFFPYSWLQARVLSRKPRIRKRPANPKQRYYTVYPVGQSRTRFSFGPDVDGNTVEVDLARFRNAIKSETQARGVLEATTLRSWDDQQGGIISFPKRKLPPSVRRQLSSRRGISNEGLAGPGGIVIRNSHGDVLAIRKERGATTERVIAMYEQLVAAGKISGKLTKRLAASRPFQRALRLVTLDIYGHKCAMCDVDIPSQLITSHIVPVSRGPASARALPSNTMLLCRLHDGLFGQGLITVRSDLTIACSPRLQTKSKLLNKWVLELHGRSIRAPSRHTPKRAFLREHGRRCGFAIARNRKRSL
jgi:hypothetical protein